MLIFLLIRQQTNKLNFRELGLLRFLRLRVHDYRVPQSNQAYVISFDKKTTLAEDANMFIRGPRGHIVQQIESDLSSKYVTHD